jgi:hypothetical protein
VHLKNCRLNPLWKRLRWRKKLRQQAEAFKKQPGLNRAVFLHEMPVVFTGNGMFCHAPCQGRVAVF